MANRIKGITVEIGGDTTELEWLISENITWSKRKMATEGQVTFNYTHVLGFKESKEGGFEQLVNGKLTQSKY